MKAKEFGKKPAGKKHTLTLLFDTKVGIENFIAWYLDAGGEQNSDYYTDNWGPDWMYLKPPEDACPECEYPNDNQQKFLDDRKLLTLEVMCQNCGHRYEQKNPYVKAKAKKKK